MRVSLRRWSAPASLVAVLMLASCAWMPCHEACSPEMAGGEGAPAASRLAPTNARFELDDMGLKHLWSQELGQLGSTAQVRNVTVTGQYLVVEAEGGEIHAFDATWGDQKAVTFLRDSLRQPPTASGGTLFFAVGQNIHSYDVATDKLSEPHRPGIPISAPLLLHGQDLVMAGSNGHLMSMPVGGRDHILLTSVEGAIIAPLVLKGSTVYAVGNEDEVVAWDLDHNGPLWYWAPPAPGRLSSGLALHRDSVYVGDSLGYIYAVGAQLPKLPWKMLAEAPVVGQPTVAGDKLLVLTNKPSVMCLDLAAGRELAWKLDDVVSVVATSAQLAYVLTEDNVLMAVSLETGETAWADPLPADCVVAGDAAKPAFYITNSHGSIVGLAEFE